MLTVIIILAALVALISFDGTWSSVLQSARNNIVFTDRNHEYGAFVLRREYHRNLIIALFFSVLTIGGLCAALMIGEMPMGNIVPPNTQVEAIDWMPPADKVHDQEKVEKQKDMSPADKPAATVQNTIVEVVDNGPTTVAKSIEDKVDKNTGTQDIDGDGPALPPGDGELGGTGDSEKKEDNTVHDWFTNAPEFPGGEKAMREYLKNNVTYSERDREEQREGTIWITFVVLKNGEVGDVTVERGILGGEELAKRCVRAVQKMPNWTPGMVNDVPVACKQRLPFKFELVKN